MLQNRVDPFGNIILTDARGAWMGNRGVIHNHHKEIVTPYKHKAWITCVLEFKGRKRTVMTPDRWTELFFLDEATAFAAGHRPCFECRREDAKKFKFFWIAGNPSYGFTMKTSIAEIDQVLHQERIDMNRKKVVHLRPSSEISNGVFVSMKDEAFVFNDGSLHRWTPFGYDQSSPAPNGVFSILTPRSIMNAFRAGYPPQMKL